MKLTRREFLGSAAAACLASPAWGQSEKRVLTPPRIIYYDNFASHLLCAFNPGMYYRIYDRLPDHVDPRPRGNTERFVRHFMGWS